MPLADPLSVVLADPKRRESLVRRFWQKVDVRSPDECWNWTARAKHDFGYGCINSGRGNLYKSHVVALALHLGGVPDGAYVLHSCDNPSCCNPAHLRVGDHAENAEDMRKRKRLVGKTGPLDRSRCARKLTIDDAQSIKRSEKNPDELAVLFGVTRHTVANVLSGRTWARA